MAGQVVQARPVLVSDQLQLLPLDVEVELLLEDVVLDPPVELGQLLPLSSLLLGQPAIVTPALAMRPARLSRARSFLSSLSSILPPQIGMLLVRVIKTPYVPETALS